MDAYFAGSTKNLKHDEEKPHAAGSKTEKKRKKVLKKLKDDEKESHAAGPKKKKKALLPDRTLEEILQVKEEPEEEDPAWKPDPTLEEMLPVKEELEVEKPGWKWKTVKLKLTMVDLKHFEEYTPSRPYGLSDLTSTDPYMINAVERAAARHHARLERRNRAVQQLKKTGIAELEMELLDDLEEDNDFAEVEKLLEVDLET